MKNLKISIMLMVLATAIITSANIVRAEENTTKSNILNKFEKNRDIRNENIENRKEIKDMRASTTMVINGMKKEMNDNREEIHRNIKDMRASSTQIFKDFKEKKREINQKMKKDTFEIRKNLLVRELKISLTNLSNLRNRINERIVKLTDAGKDTTEAKSALAIADDKITKAKIAVDSFATFTYASSTASSTEVSLEKPRQVGDAAIKAVKEARDSLKKVVEIIARLFNQWNHGTSTNQFPKPHGTSTNPLPQGTTTQATSTATSSTN